MYIITIVNDLAQRSMNAAVDEVKALAHYSSDGEVIFLKIIILYVKIDAIVGYYGCST